jgi:hypothetical protein
MSTQDELNELMKKFTDVINVYQANAEDEDKQQRLLNNLKAAHEGFLASSKPLIKPDKDGECPRGTKKCGDYCCPD